MNTIQKQPHGYENSSKLNSSRTVLSMRDQLPKSLQGTCQHIRNVISSLVSEVGVTPCSLPDGQQISQSGQALAHANHSQPQAKDSLKQMSAISGLCSLNSSASAALKQSLASRLQAQLVTVGLMEYQQTWRRKVTPAGRQYWAHTASVRRTSASDFSGWPTPNTNNIKGSYQDDAKNLARKENGRQVNLQDTARLAGRPTASSRDWKDSPGMATTGVNPDGSIRTRLDQLPRVAQMVAGWTTLDARAMNDGETLETRDARQAKNKEKQGNGNGAGMPIAIQCKTIVGWCSPTVTDADRGVLPPRSHDTGVPLTQQVAGLTSNSSTAETEKPAASQLNPHFSRWLMGFPPEWCDCAVMAMQSFPKSQRSSLKLLTQ